MSCEYCHIGHYETTYSPYVHWFKGQIMVIPNAPAYSCDICGHMEYDADFIHKLNYLLDRFSEGSTSNPGSFQQPVPFEPVYVQTTRR